jgi:putative ABC transport system permease protein
LVYQGHMLAVAPAGTVTTGAAEEDRLYMDLHTFENWSGVQPSLLEISYTGTTQQTDEALRKLQVAFGGQPVDVRPVRQIVEAEGKVIRKTRAMMLACGLLIGATVALCVGSTLTASVLERRRDFALMKALGASQRLVNGIFTAEAALLGFIASIVGFLAGWGLADVIGTVNFHASIAPRGIVFPAVFASTIVVALLSALLPLSRLQRLEPAVILKGE